MARFYGIDPMRALLLPGHLRSALLEMLPRLQAEEALLHANTVALGSGTMEKKDARKLHRRLVRMMQGPLRRDPDRMPKDPKELARNLMAQGLPVIFEEKLPDGTVRQVNLNE